TWVNVTDNALFVDQESHAGPLAFLTTQPPAFEGSPLGVNGDGELKAKVPDTLFHRFRFQRTCPFVVIHANDHKTLGSIPGMELLQGGGGCSTVGAAIPGPPADEDDLAALVFEGSRLGVDPVRELPLRCLGADQPVSGVSNACRPEEGREQQTGD